MNYKFTFTLLLISICGYAQNEVKLRDVSFTVPAQFKHIFKENKKVKYSAYNENGKVLADTIGANAFSKIVYQYYENPSQGTERAEVVLKELNHYMKEFKTDTLILNPDENYSVAQYTINYQTLFEIKSLGEEGWLNVQYINMAKNNTDNLVTALEIAQSIKHSGEYGAEYKALMKESADSSKIFIISLIFLVVVTAAGRFLKKEKQKYDDTLNN